MDQNLSFYLAGTIAIFVLGLSKGGFAGVGTISTPLLALAIGPVNAAGVLMPILLVQDVLAVVMFRREFSRAILIRMIPGAAFGIGLAYGVASAVPAWGVEIVLGAVSLSFALQQLRAPSDPGERRQGGVRGDALLGFASGMGSGFTSMIAHAGSPPFQFYVMPKGLGRDTYVGTSVIFFAAVNAMKVPAFYALGQLSLAQVETVLVFVPLALASSWLGARLVRMVDIRKFNLAITIILLLVSITLLGQGVSGLKHSL